MQSAKCSVKQSQFLSLMSAGFKETATAAADQNGSHVKDGVLREAEGFPMCNRRNMRTERGVTTKRELFVGAVSLPGRCRRGCCQK